MTEKLPLWCQAITLAALSIVLLATIRWVDNGFAADRAWRVAADTVCLYMPALNLFLGARFLWSLLRERHRDWETVVGWVAILFLLPALWAILFQFPMATQRVREASTMEQVI
jgi:ABC-type uncharacterized transport system YnjBCD permease subunit